MNILGRALVWGIALFGIAALLLVLSIPFDALIGRGRVAALTNTTIDNPDGPPVQAYLAVPAGAGPFPTVIMIHEWWGLREELIGKAEALAAEGYLVVAPDTLRGNSTGWIPRAIYQVSTVELDNVRSDLDAVYAWLNERPDVDRDQIAMIGFCYGGRTSLIYSIHNPQLAATGIFYGMTDVSVAELAPLSGPVLGIFGAADDSIPLAEVAELERKLAEAGVEHQFTIYEDQPHAFITSIEAIRAGGAPQEAWNELLEFLDRHLRNSTQR